MAVLPEMITCRTLGPVDIGVDGGAAPAELLWRKNVALLVYLARSPARRRTRDHLIGLLWGDREESAARHSLREAVRAIRRAAGDDQLGTEGDQLSLGESAVELDTDRFERLAAAGDWAGAAALVTGDFLEGFSVPDASPFEDWLGAERAYWRRRAVEALVNQGDRALSAGDIPQAAHLAERATALDPAAARAARLAMKALSLGGDRNAALAAYGRFAEQSSGTGTEPDRETRALAELLRRDREWRLPDYTRATSDRGAESRRVPLVGREPQLGAALEQWNGCRADRRARVVVVEGDPGLGKTRLADEILARARLDGAAVTAVRAVAADFAQLGSGLLGLARGGLIDASGVAGAPPPAIAALAAVASAWAERFPGSTRGSAPRPLATAFAEVLAAASRDQPVLVLVDDAQWLDDDSLLALEAVVRDLGTAAVMVLLTASPQPERPKLAELRARIGRELMGTTIRLEPLTPDALRQLARWAVPRFTDDAMDRVARRVAADSAGLPLLAVELYHAIALGLELQPATSAWPEPRKTLDQTLPGDLPDAVVAAIRVGFRRLSATAQQALAATAVLGERVSGEAIGRACGLAGDTLHGALDELEWQRWLVAEPRGYAFAARIVREVVARDMVTPGQRQRIQDAAEARR